MSTKPHSPQSPLKKVHKKSSQADHQDQPTKKSGYNISKSPFLTEGEKINFESQDSQGSDISYESSIESQEDINMGQIEYFKEEMGRFFINYPELINHDILDQRDNTFDESTKDFLQGISNNPRKPLKLNNNWSLISDQILTQAKDSCSFLQSLSHRIALYRSKIHQQDLIDILLKQQKNILKQLELQISLKKKQTKGAKNTMMELSEGSQNVYFSWRKKKEIENKLNLQRGEAETREGRSVHLKASPKAEQQKKRGMFRDRANTVSNNKLTGENAKSLNKKISDVGNNNKSNTFFLTTGDTPTNQPTLSKKPSKPPTKQQTPNPKPIPPSILNPSPLPTRRPNFNTKTFRPSRQNDRQKTIIQQQQKQNKTTPTTTNQAQTFWKHLVNFQPRTQAGRQLCQLIRRNNNPNDELGIKKTIMQFLARNRQTVQNEVVLKSTISQKIQKLYNDDSKQLLMFYPTKMTLGQPTTQSKQDSNHNNNNDRQSGLMNNGLNIGEYDSSGDGAKGYQGQSQDNGIDLNNRLFGEGEKFMHLLQDIVEGPLMKYWMMLQENKL